MTRGSIEYSSKADLVLFGPVLEATWTLPSKDAETRAQAGQTVPEPVCGFVMIDTGADKTCIAQDVAERLGLEPLRYEEGTGVGGRTSNPVYRVRLRFSLRDGSERNVVPTEREVIGIPDLHLSDAKILRAGQEHTGPITGLLGRDLLARVKFVYDGSTGRLDLEWTP